MIEFHTTNAIKEKWSDEYGKITIINYMIYGNIGQRDMSAINYAIKESFNLKKFVQIIEDIDWEMAELFNLYQGVCIQWIFPNELKDKEKVINLISEGLEYHRIKNECIGVTVDVYERTT